MGNAFTGKSGDVFVVGLWGSAIAIGSAVANHITTPFDELYEKHGKTFDVPKNLLRAIGRVESNHDPTAIGPPNTNGTRDFGLMQINSRTARDLGIAQPSDLLAPDLNVHTAARLLSLMRTELGDRFSPFTWVASYNAGTPAIKRRGIFNQSYASRVMWHWQLYELGGLFA